MITFKKIALLHSKEIVLFRIRNTFGAYVDLCNYGATLVSMAFPDSLGNFENIILCYNKIDDYFSDTFYLGSTIGRFANRIAGAQFRLNGQTYHLDKNDGVHSNHSGFTGFHSRIFDYEEKNGKIVFSYFSRDGEGGFPGNLRLMASYSFSDTNELKIEYRAISDKETIFNPTNHAYFNLSAGKNTILNHELKVYADSYLEANNEFIPTGKILPLAHTAFDFSNYQKISALMPLKKEILSGYNTYFIRDLGDGLKPLASLREPNSGRRLSVYASMPGIQVYTGDYLSAPFRPFDGIALEAQYYPDSPNQAQFPSCILRPNEEKVCIVKYVVD